jgi:DNA-binding transcriptional LysR family regulator
MRHLSDIELRLIRIFCAIVENDGFHGAQLALNMAQPTLSTHLAALEAKLGSKLCVRGRGGFRLTSAGADTYAAAQELLRNLERFDATMDVVHNRQTSRLRVGVVDSVATFAALDLPGAFGRFAAAHPEVRIELETDTPSELLNSLVKGARDVVVGTALQPLPGLEFIELCSETHHLYCGADHPWFTRPDSDLGQVDFNKVGLTVRKYMHFDDTYRLGHVKARASVSSMEAQEILILSGGFVGFLPQHRGDIWQSQGRMRAIKPQIWSIISRFVAAHDPAREGRALGLAFVDCLTETSRIIPSPPASPEQEESRP